MDEDSGMEQSRGVSLTHTSSFPYNVEDEPHLDIRTERTRTQSTYFSNSMPVKNVDIFHTIRYHWDECTPNMKGYNPAEFRLVLGISVISRA